MFIYPIITLFKLFVNYFLLIYYSITHDIIITMSEPHIALYRKYRPQSFDDVVGQEKIVELLSSSIKQKKISHAYLFCGGRGTGKTTVARIFARDIGCNPEDIIEIDAASNRGIDEIRELRDAVRTSPFSSPYKVYIIDEAHMLTKEAANALLKTLEEPPSHVIFVLATTDPEKLPGTIVSRCQKIIFSIPSLETLSKRLIYVAESEGKTLDEKTALLVATHGKGSYRDALGVLEQILTTSGKKIEHETVLTFLGITDNTMLVVLLTSICKKDTKELVGVFAKLQTSQNQALRTYDDLLEMVRQGLLSRIGKNDGPQELLILAKEYPFVFSSKIILVMLSRRYLLEVSVQTSWIAFEAISISLMEEV
jgi:DNA polymerase-3 subunit gamma/tau